MSHEVTCIACGDTGRNSKGGLCHPCNMQGREPLRASVDVAIKHAFATAAKDKRQPTEDEVVSAVKQAMQRPTQPRTMFAAGFRSRGGIMGMFAGPTDCLNELLDTAPPNDLHERNAYIVAMVRSDNPTERQKVKPVARWNGRRWVRKKKK